jgi:hypothetical protein
MARAADVIEKSNEKGGTDRGAALMTTGAISARSVSVYRFGDDDAHRIARGGGGERSRRRGGREVLHSAKLQ